jgi:hypothetical protein
MTQLFHFLSISFVCFWCTLKLMLNVEMEIFHSHSQIHFRCFTELDAILHPIPNSATINLNNCATPSQKICMLTGILIKIQNHWIDSNNDSIIIIHNIPDITFSHNDRKLFIIHTHN